VAACASVLRESAADIATLASPFESREDFENPNFVKVVVDDRGDALYFSRAPIPFARDTAQRALAVRTALHHHGLYAYRAGALERLVAAPPAPLETIEQLEQLRALALGMRIRVAVPERRPGPGVDTEEDLQRVARQLAAGLEPGRRGRRHATNAPVAGQRPVP